MQILQNPKYTSDLNVGLVAKITAMIENALKALSSSSASSKHDNTLDQTIETENETVSRNKIQSKMHHSESIKKDSEIDNE